MKVCRSGRQLKGLALVYVIALVLLWVPSCGHKEVPQQPGGLPVTTGIPMCATDASGKQRNIVITPGDSTHPPTVTVKVCTISSTAPNNTITWQCQSTTPNSCNGWQVMFDDPSLVDTQLFSGRVTFGDSKGDGSATQDQATFSPSGQVQQMLNSGPFVVKYTVQTVGSPPLDPHIVPMGP
jgi:hypothetical protein